MTHQIGGATGPAAKVAKVLRFDPLPLQGLQAERDLTLFVRDVYEQLYEETMRLRALGYPGFVFTGTPGIGKSVFRIYSMWRLAQREDSRIRRIFVQLGEGTNVLCFTCDGGVVAYTVGDFKALSLDQIADVLLFDTTKKVEPPVVATCTFVFASPNKVSTEFLKKPRVHVGSHRYFGQAEKEVYAVCRKIVIPPFDFDEIQLLLKFHDPALGDPVRLFNKFNGVPRHMVCKSTSKQDTAKCEFQSNNLAAPFNKESLNASALVVMKPVPEGGDPKPLGSSQYECEWVSAEVADWVLEQTRAHNQQQWATLILARAGVPDTGDLRGGVFQRLAYIAAWQRSSLGPPTRLGGGNAAAPPLAALRNLARDDQLDLTISPTDVDWNVPFPPVSTFVYPGVRNYPAVDAFAMIPGPPDHLILLQITLAATHPISLDGIVALTRGCPPACRIHVVFLVPAPTPEHPIRITNPQSFSRNRRVVPSNEMTAAERQLTRRVHQWTATVPLN